MDVAFFMDCVVTLIKVFTCTCTSNIESSSFFSLLLTARSEGLRTQDAGLLNLQDEPGMGCTLPRNLGLGVFLCV